MSSNTRERSLRRTVSVWINSYNQPTYLKNIVEKFVANHFLNINILDNGSTYQPLLDYYDQLQNERPTVMVFRYNANRGPRWFHYMLHYRHVLNDIPHIYTDPDIDFDLLAGDYVGRLLDLTEKHRVPKVGSALEVPTPDAFKYSGEAAAEIAARENKFWQHHLGDGVFDAAIDTTLHLFNPKYFTDREELIQGLRVAGPGYTVKHLPWYKHDPMPDEECKFYKHSDGGWSSHLQYEEPATPA